MLEVESRDCECRHLNCAWRGADRVGRRIARSASAERDCRGVGQIKCGRSKMASFSALPADRARHRLVCGVAMVRTGRYLAEDVPASAFIHFLLSGRGPRKVDVKPGVPQPRFS